MKNNDQITKVILCNYYLNNFLVFFHSYISLEARCTNACMGGAPRPGQQLGQLGPSCPVLIRVNQASQLGGGTEETWPISGSWLWAHTEHQEAAPRLSTYPLMVSAYHSDQLTSHSVSQ